MTIAELVAHGVVPVLRTPSRGLAAIAVDWLCDAGFRTVEIAMTIPGAEELIRELAGDPTLQVGAGTVGDAEQARRCIAAGARYIVAPSIVPELPAVCAEARVPCVLGALTPTEVTTALRWGADAVKIFPISSVGGIGHLRALKAVFPSTPLVPTGGIEIDEISAYLSAGAAFVGVGGKLVDPKALSSGDRTSIIDSGRQALEQVRDARR
jgi:2-dehydro-3-deoxyphosphogluconate aldolase/(4S)-4-hydroxy-2-oxoglutarate aldolase